MKESPLVLVCTISSPILGSSLCHFLPCLSLLCLPYDLAVVCLALPSCSYRIGFILTHHRY